MKGLSTEGNSNCLKTWNLVPFLGELVKRCFEEAFLLYHLSESRQIGNLGLFSTTEITSRNINI